MLLLELNRRPLKICRKFAKRMRNMEIAAVVITWRGQMMEEKAEIEARERAERMMKRVGGRWLNQEAFGCFKEWNEKWIEDLLVALMPLEELDFLETHTISVETFFIVPQIAEFLMS